MSAVQARTTQRKGERLQEFADHTAQVIMDRITASMTAHPRSQQKIIGPSEIGVPCDRALLNKLAETPEPVRRDPAWKPAVGTACHAQMEAWFSDQQAVEDGYMVEERVTVGQIGGQDIAGSCDLYNPGGFVVDWKFVGTSRLAQYRTKGPGPQYRTQAHLYGKGFEDAGHTVEIVMIVFLPRDGELRDAYFWWEPYDRSVAQAGLDRANKMYSLIDALGLQSALALYPMCGDRWCQWCDTPRRAPSTLTLDSIIN